MIVSKERNETMWKNSTVASIFSSLFLFLIFTHKAQVLRCRLMHINKKMMYQRILQREKEGEVKRKIETKLQSFVSHRWKDVERREEGGGGFR